MPQLPVDLSLQLRDFLAPRLTSAADRNANLLLFIQDWERYAEVPINENGKALASWLVAHLPTDRLQALIRGNQQGAEQASWVETLCQRIAAATADAQAPPPPSAHVRVIDEQETRVQARIAELERKRQLTTNDYQRGDIPEKNYLLVIRSLDSDLAACRADLTRLREQRLQQESTVVVTDTADPLPPDTARTTIQEATRRGEAVPLKPDDVTALSQQPPPDLSAYYSARIAEWSQPRYALNERFVQLTLLIDAGEERQEGRFQALDPERFRFDDLRDVLRERGEDPAFVVLGAPGSGKSTLLRRYQLDHCRRMLRENGEAVTFFVQLNLYRDDRPPHEWLSAVWAERYPDLPPLETFLAAGKAVLLLDALNEMPHRSPADYAERVGRWRAFVQEVVRPGNRVIASCRSLDYSAPLSSDSLRVPQIQVQPMSAEQVEGFLGAYLPDQGAAVWDALRGTPQFDLFRTPYFLKLLVEQVQADGIVPEGRAALFTGFVRRALKRETERGSRLFLPDGLLTEDDHLSLTRDRYPGRYALPDDGLLVPSLSRFAYKMQANREASDAGQVLVDRKTARQLLASERDRDILKAGVALAVLDEDSTRSIKFFHQLLQEFFAARALSEEPDPALVRVPWQVDAVSPTIEEELARIGDNDSLPPLPTTGWEETTVLAAAMAANPDAFVRGLIAANLPLAARCAAAPDVRVSDDLKDELRGLLVARSQDFANADLRARIEAGLRLGELGDPRFERKTGPHGDYLTPPMVTVPAGTYPIGDDNSQYERERPAHTVTLEAFEIGQFPVTNAEYALFMAAGGYEDEAWWDTAEAKAWRRGEGSTEGQKLREREFRQTLQGITEEQIRDLVPERITSKQADDFITIRNWSDERFEEWLDETYPSGQIYRQPEYWDDTRFNAPSQPVVGVSWFEARAYCNWLSAQTGQPFVLPSEAQFEAAARGPAGREYPYGSPFDATRSNTFESHIRRTTPVGIFDNATPEGAFDLTGNAYTWTRSLYDQEAYPYPYRAADGRENIRANGPRVLRGGGWFNTDSSARAAFRFDLTPDDRGYDFGLVLCRVRPPSL